MTRTAQFNRSMQQECFLSHRVIETCRLITGGDRLLYSVRWSDPSPAPAAAAAATDGNMSASRGLVLLAGSQSQSTQPTGSRCFVPGCTGRDLRGGQERRKVCRTLKCHFDALH